MSRKLLLEDAHGRREFLLVGTLTVGRDPRCEISANDPLLSRQHAEFVETATGVLVRDLHSQNGIRVNDIAVKEAALRSGDIVQIARMSLRFLEEASTHPGVAPAAGGSAGAGDDDKTRVLKAPGRSNVTPPAGAGSDAGAAPAANAAAVPDAAASSAGAPGPAVPSGASGASDAAARNVAPSGTSEAQPHAKAAPASSTPAPPLVGTLDAAAAEDDGDRTRVVQRPSLAARGGGKPAAPAAAPATPVPAAATPAPAARPAAPPAAPAATPSAGGAAKSAARAATPAAPAIAESTPIDNDAPAAAIARTPRGTWAGRVLLRILVLGLLCSLASAVPLMFWHQQQVRAVALSRATTLANWFAAEAALALERGHDAGPAIDALSTEAGVVAARVLSPEGHVIAPATRAAEVVSGFPGIDATPADVLRQRSGWNGDLLEVVQPIATSRGPRTALAWITVNPTTEFGGSSLVIVAPAVVGAIFLAWIVAMLITRPTLRALGQLNEDIELALSGRLAGVTDPLGAKPVKELTDTISYLAARMRTTGVDVGFDPGRRGPSIVGGTTGQQPAFSGAAAAPGATAADASQKAARDAASAAAPASGASGTASASSAYAAGARAGQAAAASASASRANQVAANQAAANAAAAAADASPAGHLIVDTAFRVTDADAPCAVLLGTRTEALIGHHLLDAITDRLIVDAVLGCLSALPPSGEREATATDANGRIIAVLVGRTAKDQPVTVTLRATEAREA